MHHPVNRIRECEDGVHRVVGIDERVAIVVHRCGMGSTAAEISAAYQQHPAAGQTTGWQMPYTIVIRPDGPDMVEQALRLGDYGPHAIAWNTLAIGIAMVGDFRKHRPPRPQYEALLIVCHTLSGWIGGASRIFGHDELCDGTERERSECPGELLDMQQLRHDVRHADLCRVLTAGYKR